MCCPSVWVPLFSSIKLGIWVSWSLRDLGSLHLINHQNQSLMLYVKSSGGKFKGRQLCNVLCTKLEDVCPWKSTSIHPSVHWFTGTFNNSFPDSINIIEHLQYSLNHYILSSVGKDYSLYWTCMQSQCLANHKCLNICQMNEKGNYATCFIGTTGWGEWFCFTLVHFSNFLVIVLMQC